MSRRAKQYLLVAGVMAFLGCAALGVAYKHRGFVKRILRGFKQAARPGDPVGHAVPPAVLEIGGKKFAHVLGYPPYYLEVKPLDSVLFVTWVTAGGSNVFHVLNLKTGRDTLIPTIADFGRNIGLTNGDFRDYVDQAAPGMVVAASETSVGVRTKTVYYLNLGTAKMEARETFYFNRNGNLTNRVRLPGF